jgi:hypothetical protein
MSDWTRRERKTGRRALRRRYATTVRWTQDELGELQRIMPPGMRLAEFVRRSTLDRVGERGGDDPKVRREIRP